MGKHSIKPFESNFKVLKNILSSLLPVILLLAGGGARAQFIDVSITGGLQRSTSSVGQIEFFNNWTTGGNVCAKVAITYPTGLGVGGFWEGSRISAPSYLGSTREVVIANPMHFFGLEVYHRGRVGRKTYLQFGPLLGLAVARQEGSTDNALGIGGGLDATLRIVLNQRISALLNGGFRYLSVNYGSTLNIATINFPITVGLGYRFGNARKPVKQETVESSRQ